MKKIIVLFFVFIYLISYAEINANNLNLNLIDKKIQEGIKAYENGDQQKASLILNELLKYNTLNNFQKTNVYNNLGNIYADKGDNIKALQYYHNALHLSRISKSQTEEGKILKNIGALYLSWKKFDEALTYYKKAKKIGESRQDLKLIADCYNNLGTVYEQQNQLKQAEEVYIKALEFYKKEKLFVDVAMVYSNLAIVYKNTGKIELSIESNLKALNFAKKSNDLWIVSAISNNLGNVYTEKGEFDLAEGYIQQAIQLSTEISALEITIMAFESMADLYAKKGDFKKAFFYQKKMNTLNNEFINSNQTQQFSELEVKFKTKEKELENQKLIFEKKQIKRQNVFNIAIFIFIFLLVLIIVISYLRIKRHKLLNKKQQELNHAVLESETKERFRIARDLHDSVGQMLSVIKMHLSNTNENEALGELVDKTISEVRTISHNLIPEALNFGLKRALEELIEKSQLQQKVLINMDFKINKSDLQLAQEKELMLFRIIQELLGNTLKHAQATEIQLILSVSNTNVIVTFRENGIGFDTKKIAQSSGLGWKNTYARLSLIGGVIEISSQKNKGSNIKITLPNA